MNALHLERCRQHPEREAAVRCPACRRFFCRECAGEHEGRLLCAECIAAATRPAAARQGRWGWLSLGLTCLCGVVLTWWVFGLVGRILTEVPDEFHEGTYWRFLDWQD